MASYHGPQLTSYTATSPTTPIIRHQTTPMLILNAPPAHYIPLPVVDDGAYQHTRPSGTLPTPPSTPLRVTQNRTNSPGIPPNAPRMRCIPLPEI
ncbi:hypothetical protein M422DRAFT_777215 [Sphaerobolus stellatus SS14]|nr:hypothetical protein M422DRAFT_777215 [Sphaerobolus stellatus SS14]